MMEVGKSFVNKIVLVGFGKNIRHTLKFWRLPTMNHEKSAYQKHKGAYLI